MSVWNNKIKAFSLLELSIVLTIMGIVASLYVPNLINSNIIHKQQISRQRINKIWQALAIYVNKKNKMPEPAYNNIITINSKVRSTGSGVLLRGFIPYQSIGIDYEDTKDGFNRPFHYIIRAGHNVGIAVKNKLGEDIYDINDDTAQISVVIISEGNARAKPLSAFEKHNLRSTDYIYKMAYMAVKNNEFRQSVYCNTYNKLILLGSGKIIANTNSNSSRINANRGLNLFG